MTDEDVASEDESNDNSDDDNDGDRTYCVGGEVTRYESSYDHVYDDRSSGSLTQGLRPIVHPTSSERQKREE